MAIYFKGPSDLIVSYIDKSNTDFILKMIKGKFRYNVGGLWIDRTYETMELINPPDEALILKDTNMIDRISENQNGFLIKKFISFERMDFIESEVLKFLSEAFETRLDKSNIDQTLLAMSDEEFHERMKKIYLGIALENLAIGFEEFITWVSDAVKREVKMQNAYDYPSLLIRIVRPNRPDYNPPHRDIYLDHLRNGLNGFMPVLGVNRESSLSLIPGSHLWSEQETIRTTPNSLIDGIKFSVPAVISLKDGQSLNLMRPVVERGEIMLFSPYLIHGGAANVSNRVRVSFEFRFW